MAEDDVWYRPGGRSPFSFDPDKPMGPQIFEAVWQGGTIFVGPALALFAIARYPVIILNQTLYVTGLGTIAVFFVASFVIIRDASLPRGMPTNMKIMFRAGWALGTTFLLLGIGLIANGAGMPISHREASVVAKRETLQHDPSRRTYYIEVRAWPGSRSVTELSGSPAVYRGLAVPIVSMNAPQSDLDTMADAGHVDLIVGQGRFGLEWLKGIE